MDAKPGRIEVLKANMNMITLYGMCFQRHAPYGTSSKIKNVIIGVLLGFLPHCATLHFIFNMYYRKALEQYELVEDLFIMASNVTYSYIIFCFIFRRNATTDLVDALGDFTNFGKPKNAEQTNAKIELLVKVHWIYTMTGVLVYTIYGIFETEACEQIKSKNKSLNVCGLMSNTWFPFDIDFFPVKQIIFGLQVISVMAFLSVASSSVNMLLASAEHIILRIDHYVEILITVFTLNSIEERRKRLSLCIKYHNYIIDLTEMTDSCFRPMMLIHITLAAIIVATVSYVFLITYSVKYMLYLIGCLIAVFMVCLAGQRLQDKSSEICWAIYSLAWYNDDAVIQKDIALIILRSQKDLTLNAGGFAVLNFETFKMITQTIYSYLTLLSTTIK